MSIMGVFITTHRSTDNSTYRGGKGDENKMTWKLYPSRKSERGIEDIRWWNSKTKLFVPNVFRATKKTAVVGGVVAGVWTTPHIKPRKRLID